MFGAQAAGAAPAISSTASSYSAPIDLDQQQDSGSTDRPQLTIGCLVYLQQGQIDIASPFGILSRLPGATVHVIAKSREAIRDVKGLILTPEMTIAEAPQLGLLVVSGGLGQQALMVDDEVLTSLRQQAHLATIRRPCAPERCCAGPARLLRVRRATTHWAAWDLPAYYGASPVTSRVVVDRKLITTAGATAGLDGLDSTLRGRRTGERIQLEIEHAPDPPFHSETPETAVPEVVEALSTLNGPVRKAREAEAKHFALTVGSL